MPRFLGAGLLFLNLIGCSNNSILVPKKLAQNVRVVPATTIFFVTALETLYPPTAMQSIVQLARFRARDNLYDLSDNRVLIPRGAIIVALYSNDGIRCNLDWKAIYTSTKEYHLQRGSLALDDVTTHSLCNPEHKIKPGEEILLHFKSNLSDDE